MSEPGRPDSAQTSRRYGHTDARRRSFRLTDKITFGSFIIYCVTEIPVSVLSDTTDDDITFTVSASDKITVFKMLSNI